MASASESNNNHNNNCVICLDSLLAPKDGDNNIEGMCDLGAVVGCGHLVHVSCWESWKSFKKSSSEGTPCPTCQQQSKSFLKVFLHGVNQHEPRTENIDANISDFSDDEDDDAENDDNRALITNTAESSIECGTKPAPPPSTTSGATCTSAISMCCGTLKRRSKYHKLLSPARASTNKKSKPRLSPKVRKKLVRYKYAWKASDLRLKVSHARLEMMKLEAEHRKRCHHADLVDLEQSRLLNFKLAKELEQFEEASRFRRNLLAAVCFGVGIVWGKARLFGVR